MPIGFSAANLAILFRTGIPVVDMFTGGKAAGAMDEIGDRAAAFEIALTEAAEFFAAVKDAARDGVDEAAIFRVVAEAKDVVQAKELLKDPSKTVILDGEETTADDDPPAEKKAGGKTSNKKK